MKSPRFSVRAETLKHIFTPAKINNIWNRKVKFDVRNQYVMDPIDFFDFDMQKQIESEKLSLSVLSGTYIPGNPMRVLVEKSKGLCRQIVIPHVRDAIVLQCLADVLYSQVKSKAPSPNAFFEQKDHKFSVGLSGYGTFAAWLNFQKTLLSFRKTRRYIVVTDIANYYDSISYVHLRNSLSCIAGVDESILDMLIFVLSSMLWQPDYSPRVEVGLPQMDLDAPRLMAHCLLYEVDAYLQQQKDADFTRFMDDIDVGVDSIKAAKEILKSVDLVLQAKQIRLNSGKTIIMRSEEALSYFRVFDNSFLDTITARIEHKVALGVPISNEIRLIKRRISNGLAQGRFDKGHGDKILKRWIGLASKAKATLRLKDVRSILLNRPNQRDAILRYVCLQGFAPAYLRVLVEVFKTGQLVDEAAWLEAVNSLLHTKFSSRKGLAIIDKFIDEVDIKTVYGFHVVCLLLSRTRQIDRLWLLIKNLTAHWRVHNFLGRTVAAFYPQIKEIGFAVDFAILINKSGNEGALEVFNFHELLESDLKIYKDIKVNLSAQNPSLPLKYRYSKYLLLLSALANQSASSADLLNLKNKANFLLDDAYLKKTPILL